MDRVHEWLVYRREVTRTPFRALAAEMGLPKSTVQKFYAQKTYPQKIWPRLRDWYMRNQASRAPYQTPPDEMVLSAARMFLGLPAAGRPGGMRRVAEAVREYYAEMRQPVPEWVEVLEESAELAARSPEPPEEFEYRIPDSGRPDA